MDTLKRRVIKNGWRVLPSDPLKLTIDACAAGTTGTALAQKLREHGMECEFADPETLVLMLTPENTDEDLRRLEAALGRNVSAARTWPELPAAKGRRVMSVREAMFAEHETIPVNQALGRICGAPTVACPPAIPIAVSGEEITGEALTLFAHYGTEMVDVVKA